MKAILQKLLSCENIFPARALALFLAAVSLFTFLIAAAEAKFPPPAITGAVADFTNHTITITGQISAQRSHLS